MKDTVGAPKQLNILYAHRTRGADVEGVHIRGMSQAFIQHGHKVTFIAPPRTGNGSNRNETKKGFTYNFWKNFSRYCPQLFFEFLELVYNFYLYFSLLQKSKEQRIDFIYERYALNTFASVLFGKRHNIPVILEVNDATGIPRVRKHKVEYIASKIEKWVLENCAAIVTISSEFQQILGQVVSSKEKISFVPNAVDPDIFNPANYDDEIRSKYCKDKVVVGFIGSFAFWHRVDLLIDIVPAIIQQTTNVHFLLVGDGRELDKCKEKVQTQQLSPYVTFTGRIPFAKVPLYLKAMDIGVIPDSNTYGSPVKLFEYMAMGVAPVAPKLPPIFDVLEDGETGVLFAPGSKSGLESALLSLCQDGARREAIAAKARKQVFERHLWCHNANHVLKIYHQLCG